MRISVFGIGYVGVVSCGCLASLGHEVIGVDVSAEKVALLEKVEKMARAKDPRVVQVMASLGGEYDVVMVARSDGVIAADLRPLVRMSVTVIAEQGGRREMGHAGGGGPLPGLR